MISIKLASFFVLTAVSITKNQVKGEIILSQGEEKEQGVKLADKRIDNFRVPVENPFDPNFWPARGRKREEILIKSLLSNNCAASDENYVYDKGNTPCPQSLSDEEQERKFNPSEVLGNCLSFLIKSNTSEMPDFCRRILKFRGPKAYQGNLWYRMTKGGDDRRRKKQRHADLPQIMVLYGNGVYWEIDNSFAEKEKKQDVFWVARGKKSNL